MISHVIDRGVVGNILCTLYRKENTCNLYRSEECMVLITEKKQKGNIFVKEKKPFFC
jgi:hypothetical protein